MLETAGEGIVAINARGIVESFNEAAAEMFGYPAEEVVGQNVSMLMPSPDAEHHDGYLADYLRTGHTRVVGIEREVEGRRRDGTLFPMELNVREVDTDRIHVFTAVICDLTEHKRTESALRASHKYVRNIIDSMIGSLIVVASDGRIVMVNMATCEMLGYTEDEMIGMPAGTLFEEEDNALFVLFFQALAESRESCARTGAGHVNGAEGWYATKDGRRVPVTFSASVMRDDNRAIQGFVCVAQDNTEHKQLQCELAQAQKLESVGQLAAGIAHEINTPTQYVGDNTRFLKDGFGDLCTTLDKFETLLQAAKNGTVDEQLVAEVEATLEQADVEYLREEIPQAIDQSLDGVERVAKIVRAMKEFSHPGGDEKSLVNLTEAIETTITVARNEWKYVAEIATDFDSELPQVSCLPGELNQVFLNLIVNAAQAIGDALGDDATNKGTITVGTRRDGEWAVIFVRDTGTGIPDDVRARIFDPFFTTKEVGKGTGQGLAIARSVVVDKHGGTIDCETEPGQGTTFHCPAADRRGTTNTGDIEI
ncbi:MAG: PAS domain S-box protein [Planctomycetaceae bacterium]